MDAQALETAGEGEGDLLVRRIHQQDLERHGQSVLGPPQRSVPYFPACLGQQTQCRLEVCPGAAVDRRRPVWHFEQLTGQLLPKGLQQVEFTGPRNAARTEFRVVEDAARALVGAVQQRFVDRGEVERMREPIPNPAVGEDLPPRVENEGGHAGGSIVRQPFQLHAAVRDRREVVPGCPTLAGELQAKVVLAGLEGLHHHIAVAVVVVADTVEVVLPAVDGQAPSPIFGVTAIGDATARVHALDAIRAAADRWNQRRPLELHRCVVGLGQDRHQSHDQRQLAIRRRGVEDEPYRACVGPFDAPDLPVVQPVVGPSVFLEGFPGEDDIVHGDRPAIVKASFRPQHERDGRTVIRHLDRLGDQTVERERLVPRSLQKALEDQVASARRHALDDEGVEVVERPGHRAPKLATLRRVGIHVVEMAEPGVVFGLPMHGDAVALRRCGTHTARDQNHEEPDEHRRQAAKARRRRSDGTGARVSFFRRMALCHARLGAGPK